MNFILVVWTVISTAGTQYTVHEHMGWKSIGEFKALEYCQGAAAQLGYPKEKYRCLPKG